jgi:hypothetical protein
LKNDEWGGGGNVIRVITNDGKLMELKKGNEFEKKMPKKMLKGHEWDSVLKIWSDREVSLAEIRYLWVEQIEAGRTILYIIAISAFAIITGDIISRTKPWDF